MKTINIIYWITTILIVGLMAFSSISSFAMAEESQKMFAQMGYPVYLINFLSIAKLLGCVVLLVPGFNRLKEWAYAGFTFDLLGAFYSFLAIGTPFGEVFTFLIFLAVLAVSYIYHHKRIAAKGQASLA